MRMPSRIFTGFGVGLAILISCSPPDKKANLEPVLGESFNPITVYQSVKDVIIGEPLGISVGMREDIFLADGLPGRIIFFQTSGDSAFEFQEPFRNPSFYPSDLKYHGFFLYAVDEVGRSLLRFDNDGAYRDLLLNFNEKILGRRISPYGLDVDAQGRVAITDVENHQILVFNSYLALEVVFGNYGSYPGQLDTPKGVFITEAGDLVVADSGNKRIQFFGEGGDFQRIVPQVEEDNPLQHPRRAVVDKEGRIYVADPLAGRLFLFDSAGRLIFSLYPKGAVDFKPTDVEVTRTGLIYVTDAASRSLFVFKVMSY